MSINEEVIIREYKSEDKESILHLLRLNTPKYFSPEEEKELVYYLDHQIEHYFVIELANQLVGCGGINFDDETTGVLSWDIIHPGFQGKSLGRSLGNFRIEKLLEFKDVKRIIVRTSQLTYQFYEKLGFEPIEIIEDYWAKGFDLYKMEYKKMAALIV